MQNTTTTTGQPVRVVTEAAPLSDAQLARVGLDEVPDGQSQRWLVVQLSAAVIGISKLLTRYAQRQRSATAGAFARAFEAGGKAMTGRD